MRRLPPALAAWATPQILELLGEPPGPCSSSGSRASTRGRSSLRAGRWSSSSPTRPTQSGHASVGPTWPSGQRGGSTQSSHPRARTWKGSTQRGPSSWTTAEPLQCRDDDRRALRRDRGLVRQRVPAGRQGETWETLARLIGDPAGALIDIGCGTGGYAAALAERGWDVTGVDVSEDMLRRAEAKGVRTVRADAATLPFEDASFDAATRSSRTRTSTISPASSDRPCACSGPAPRSSSSPSTRASSARTRSTTSTGRAGAPPGWYRRRGRYDEAPGIWRGSGVRIRVGASHLPLGLFLQTFLDTGLQLERVEEPDEREYPFALALRWRRQ